MNRRELFRFLPLGAMAIPGVAKAAKEPQKPAEPSPWAEWNCTARFGPEENWMDRKPCGTKFMSIRGAQPICPNCRMTMCARDDNGGFEKVCGIEVK